MGGAHGVYVEAFHQRNVAQKLLRIHHIALQGGIVVVDALELDRLAVQGENVFFNSNTAEACVIAQALHRLAILF